MSGALNDMQATAATKNYFPQLDALRGLSFIAVFFYHAWHPDFGNGNFAKAARFFYSYLDYSIDVFFVLSAFLLTYLGIAEYQKRGKFSFRNYFLRRALRIWPLYYLLMALSFVVLPWVAARAGYTPSIPPASWYLFFVSNFYEGEHVYFLRFLWTLSVEEQFYMVLGLSLLFFQRYIKTSVLVMLLIGVGFCTWYTLHGYTHYFHTLNYLADFAAGSLAAVMLRQNKALPQFWLRRDRLFYWLFYAAVPVSMILVCVFTLGQSSPLAQFIQFMGRLIFAFFIAAFILEQLLNQKTLFRIGKSKLLIYTGKISYGLYCFHGIVLSAGSLMLTRWEIKLPGFWAALAFLVVNYIMAAASYRFLEMPFLRIKDRLRKI